MTNLINPPGSRNPDLPVSREQFVDAARKLWGPENRRLSTKKELRFGRKGAKSVLLDDMVWVDHSGETPSRNGKSGGGAIELCELAGLRIDHDQPARLSGTRKTKSEKSGDEWHPMVPPPSGVPAPASQQLAWDTVFRYFDADERLMLYVRRNEAKADEAKIIRPLTYGTLGAVTDWLSKAPNPPLPLYGLNLLKLFPTHTVVLVEGENKADAINRMAREEGLAVIGISWFGGASRLAHTDLSPLAGREVIVWPDADTPGRLAGTAACARLQNSPTLGVVNTDDLPEAYDAANLERDGGNLGHYMDTRITWLRPVRQETPTQAPSLPVKRGWDASELQPMGTIVHGLLHAGSLSLFYGPPKSGKSFLLTDLFLSVAAGDGEWLGHDIRRHGPMLYVACEGHAGFPKRLKGAALRRGWGQTSFPQNFYLASGRPQLVRLDAHGRVAFPQPDEILATIDAMPEKPIAVAIDTVFRSIGAGNVNDSTHMNAYLAALAAITDLGVAVAIVHHETKAGGTPAGSVALLGAADTIVVTANGEADHSWAVEAAKDDANSPARRFSLEIIDLGIDPEGFPASSCVVVPIAGLAASTKPLNPSYRALYDIAAELLASGQLIQPLPDMPHVAGITRTALRTALSARGWFRDDPPSRTDLTREWNALNGCKVRSLLGFDRDWVWLARS